MIKSNLKFVIYGITFIGLVSIFISFYSSLKSPYISNNVVNFSNQNKTLLHKNIKQRNIDIWKDQVIHLVKKEKWKALKYIMPIGYKNFKQSNIWKNQNFNNYLSIWLKHKANDQWIVGKDNNSIWTSSISKNNKPTASMGIRKIGSKWWIVLVLPKKFINNDNICKNYCYFKIKSVVTKGGISTKNIFHLRALKPSLYKSEENNLILGALLPIEKIKSYQDIWNISIIKENNSNNHNKNKLSFTFDMSYLKFVCNNKLLNCF